MFLKNHFTVSVVLGLSFGFLFKSYLAGLSAWLVGWAMDCDHLFDYFLYLRKFKTKFNLQEFFDGVFFDKLGKIYILGHAWEYLILYIIIGYLILPWQFIIAIGFSYGLHLLLDQFDNKVYPGMYFLFYRIKVNFNVNKLCYF